MHTHAHNSQENIGGDSGITDENKAILERVRVNTRQEYLQGGGASGSIRATDRLMRELQDIYRSQNFKDGVCVCGKEGGRKTLDAICVKPWEG